MSIDKANIQNLYRLSPLQGGMLFHALYDEEDGSYFEQGIYRIEGEIDAAAFEKAWNILVERHDALRTAFVVKGAPEPLQIVLKKRPLDFRFADHSGLTEGEWENEIARYSAQDKERGFNLTNDPLIRIALFRKSPHRHTMILSFHHIIMDGWCQGILAGEFMTVYKALPENRPVPLPPAPQYREYIRWLERQDKEGALSFWSGYLQGFVRPTWFPRNERNREKREQQHVRFALNSSDTAALKEYAVRCGVTLSTVVQGLWGILLGRLNGTNDAVFLGTVSGRPVDLENAGNIVGLFINALPTRVRFQEEESFADLAARLRKESGESQPRQFAPLAEIQGTTSLKRELANTLLVFENYPFASSADAPFAITQEKIDERTNYDLTVQIHPDEELGFGIAFDPGIIDPESVAAVEGWLTDAARLLAEKADVRPADFSAEHPLFTTWGVQKKEKTEERKEGKPLQVAVAATFTVDPALPYLEWWLRERGYAPAVEIAPYNQIFQELLDPASLLSRTEGFGLLAVRFEDWIRDLADADDAEIVRSLERSYSGYLQGIDRFGGKAVLVHVLLPTRFSSFSPSVAETLRELQERIIRDAADRGHLFLLDARNLQTLYGVGNPFDPVADAAGHVPYTPEMNGAIGSAMARKILSRDQHPFKVIAVDCDNTLWKGVCGEEGATGVQVYGGYRALQEFLIERYEEGFLIALCSKNNENDVWEVFEKNEGMILRREHVVAHRINWRPKSGNLHEMADELNVGINSFLFIDDSGMECAEVRENACDVLALRLPENEAAIPRFLGHIWALDKWQVTDEDRKRSGMYVAEQRRQQDQEQATSLEDFLRSLELKIVMAPVAEHQVPRVSQLTQRTNQFNISTIRRDESEIRDLIADDRYFCRVVTVEDRFGEYGLVGVIICRRDEEKLFLDSLLLSCRVLGRGVEEAILTGMRRYAEAHSLAEIEALFIPTKKNAPALHFLETWPEVREELENGNIIFRRSVAGLPDGVPFGLFEDRTEPLPEEEKNEKAASGISASAASSHNERERTETEKIEEGEESLAGWEINLEETANLLHAPYYLPLARTTGKELLLLPVVSAAGHAPQAEYVPPATPDELALIEIYRQVLRIGPESVLGMRDNFFDLGGHSLTAVELLSRIHRRFHAEIRLREIFENPTPELLMERIRVAETNALPPIESLPPQNYYELSHAQTRLWALDDIQSEGAAYIMGGGTLVEGDLDADALEDAFRSVIRRHASLRTAIVSADSRPMAKILDHVPFSLERIDLSTSSLSAEEKEEEAFRIATEREGLRFDLTAPPLMRATLIGLEADRSVLLIYIHHIVADGWSYPILMRELVEFYKAHGSAGEGIDPGELFPPLSIHYHDYAAWQHRELESARGAEDNAFWLERLAPPLPVLELPTDRPRPTNPTYGGDSLQVTLNRKEAERITALCGAEGATLFMFLLAGVRSLLWRYAGARETVIGVPVAGRDHPDLIDQIGFYVNTLALRGAVDPEQSFARLLGTVRDEVLEAFAHRSTPFDLIVGQLEGLERETGRSPVFDVMVALQNNRDFDEEIEGLRFRSFGREAGAGKFDLVFNFSEVPEGIICSLEYRTELFNRETIGEIGEELVRLVLRASAAPDRPLMESLISFDEIRQESRKVEETSIPEGTIIDRFRRTAQRFPEKIAVRHGDAAVTYRRLDQRSDTVALSLKAHGAAKGEIIAVVLERGVDLVAAMLGIMKGGRIYLPIDPAYPDSRIREILEKSGARFAVGCRKEILPPDCTEVTVADLFTAVEPVSEGTPTISPEDPAYVIYTSGSTGQPKGVCVGHRGFLNMIATQIETFGVVATDTVLQFASAAFDASLSEFFMALLVGAELTIPERKDVEEIESFLKLLHEKEITVATIPPVYLRAIERRPMPTLRVLITAGEEAPKEDVLHYARTMAVFNAYGPTECSVCATIHQVSPDESCGERIPIGRTISGVGAFVADDRLLPLPDGAPGELILYGTGLAHGYLNDPATTGDRFVFPSWFDGIRCYRTGDRARRIPAGGFEFLGRIDNQVKIRGHRVEPEETRQALLRNRAVRDAAILVVSHPGVGKSLAAFVCGDASLTPSDLLSRLAEELPPFLLPQHVQIIDGLPMTVNGKVDKKRLEELYRNRAAAGGTPDPEENDLPRNDVETALAQAFAQVLRLDRRVGIHENFFTLGGDSMKAIQLRALLGRMGYDLRSRHIFEGGTIARIARHVKTETGRHEENEIEGRIAPTPIQEWMMERLGREEAPRFGLSLVADACERVEESILKRALLDIAGRHDALRIRAALPEGTLSLEVGSRFDEIPLHIVDLSGHNDADKGEEEIAAAIANLAAEFPFDGTSPLFRVGLIRTAERDMVVLALHHLITDAHSLDILLNDLNECYAARRSGKEPEPANEGTSFAAWSRSLDEYVRDIPEAHKEEWKETARRAAEIPAPFGHATAGHEIRSSLFAVGRELTETLRSQRKRGIELHHILLAALRQTLRKMTGAEELAVLMEGHGRGIDDLPDITRTVGWFTATYPVILGADYDSLGDELRSIRQTLDRLKGREGEYGTLRYRADDPSLREALQSRPQIGFNYLGEFGGEFSSDTPHLFRHTTHQTAGENRSLLDFEMHLLVEDGEIKIRSTCGPAVPTFFAAGFQADYITELEEIAAQLRKKGKSELRLLCLPSVGGEARSFAPLAQALPDSIELVALELPGHGERLRETPLHDIGAMVDDLTRQMFDDPDRPYILLGHSLGALLAYETLRRIRHTGKPQPELLLCAGAAAPRYFGEGEEKKEREEMNAEMIAAYYSDRGGSGMKGNDSELAIAAAQADMAAVAAYRYVAGEPLDIPIMLLYGSTDEVPMEGIRAWREETTDETSLCEIAGGHDFPISNPAATAAAIVRAWDKAKARTEEPL